jgi:hypothetical protein
MRTLTAYGIAVVIVFAILNGIFWLVSNPRLHSLNVFSAGFFLGMLGMYIAAWLYRISPGHLIGFEPRGQSFAFMRSRPSILKSSPVSVKFFQS